MFNKYQGIFRSRWKALWWAAGMLLTAYCTVPSAHKSSAPPVKLSTLNHMLHHHGHAKPPPDPWGYDTPPAKPG